MADTKTNEIKTRISLKYDTLEHWNTSTFKLLPGELAIVSLGNTADGTTAGEVNQHPVLFKVGTGDHTFSQLPYASALAADVYAWAKASDVVLEGKTIKFVDTNKTITFNYITETEASDLIDAALANYSTTAEMNTAIKVETDRAMAAEEALDQRINNLNVPEGGFASASDFADLKAKVEDEDGALDRANAAYTLAEGKTTMAEVEGKGYAVASEVNNKLDEKVYKVTGKSLVADSEITKLATIAEGAQVNVIETVKVNGTALSVSDKAVDVTVPTEEEIREYAADQINILLEGVNKDDTIDNIIELVDYVNKNAADITQLVTDVSTANTNASNAVTTANNANATAGQALEKAEEALEGAEGAQNAKTAAEAAQAKAEEAQGKAEDAQEAAEAARDEAVNSNTSATAIATEAKGTADAAKEASEAATAAVAGLHAIATSGNIADLEQTENTYVVFNCGSASEVI